LEHRETALQRALRGLQHMLLPFGCRQGNLLLGRLEQLLVQGLRQVQALRCQDICMNEARLTVS